MSKRVVIITAQNFQDEEFVYPYYRLLEEGFDVQVATPDKAPVVGKYGVPSRPTMDTKDLKAGDFDAVVIPGGFEAPDRLRIRPEVLAFVKEMNAAKKLVAAICHGPWVLISAGVVKGRSVTGFQAIADDLKNAGARYTDAPVVIDGNIISSPHYRNNGDFMKEVVRVLKGM